MAGLDELFDEQQTEEKNTDSSKENKTFDKDIWIKQKKESREEAYKMVDERLSSIGDVSKLNEYLKVQSNFDRYSVTNALLVAEQMPDATRLCDSKQWQKYGAFIKKGEKAITVLAPGEEFTKSDGSTGVSYNAKKVFDISQTTMKPKETEKAPVDENKLIKALIKSSPVSIVISDNVPNGMNAFYSPADKEILIRQGLNVNDIFRALSNEIVHARSDRDSNDYTREVCNIKAYCVSYILCSRQGITPNEYSCSDSPFKGDDNKTIRSKLNVIKDEADDIHNVVDRALNDKNRDAR